MPYRASQDTQFIGAFGELTAAEELRVQEIQALSDTDTDEALGKLSGSVVKKSVEGGTAYTLPIAAASTLGGIKVGTRLSIDVNGVLSADVQSGGGDVLGPASNTADYIPQWDGANSKTLKNGISISTFAPALGEDDNYVTDAEKSNLHAPGSDDQAASDFDIKDLTDSTNLRTAWTGKQDALTFGIADTNKVQINAADVADNDYAKFTATGLEGRSYSEVLSDIGAAASGHNHTGTYEPADATLQSSKHTHSNKATLDNITAAYTTAEATKLGNIEASADVTDATNVAAAGAVMEADYNANTILAATTDNTPAALTVGEQTIVGRKTGGAITALSASEVRTILNVADGATANTKAASSDIDTGTDDAKFVTADALAGSVMGTKTVQLKIVDDATVLTTGDGKLIFCIPPELNGMNLVDVDAMISTVSSSGAPLVQIRNVTDSADMLSTRITIDATEFTSYTAETAPVIDGTHDDVATGDRIAIDVDGAGTGAKGLAIILSFKLP